MALVVADRIKETTSTTGTGTYTLAGATTGFEAFSVIGNGNTTYYCCTDSTDFEVGIGTYTSSGTTLARTTILQSSNSDNAVNWSSGTRDIFVTQPAEKAVFKDASGHIQAVDGRNLTNLSAGNLTGTVANARLDQQLQDVAGLAVTNGNFIVGDGSNFVAESGSTARTSLGLGTASVLDTGISNTNIPKFTSGVADNDFLRVDGTAIEGRSASEVLSDIGGQASLTFGISNTNAVKIDSSSVADDEYARFTASGLESRSTSEVLSDIGGQASLTFGISNTNAVKIDSSSVADDEFARFTSSGLESRSASEVRSDLGLATSATTDTTDASNIGSGTLPNARLDAQLQDVAGLAVTNGNFIVGDGSNFVAESGSTARTSLGLGTASVLDTGISNTNVPKFTSGVADNDFLKVDGTAIEGRSASEVRSDLGLATSATTDTTNASNIGSGTLPNARLDAQLQDVAGLAVTNGNFIVGDGSNFVAESGSTARTSLGLGTAAVLDTGISNTNIPKFTSGVADNDFLRVDGTAIEGRSASEVLSDIGGQASLTFGISNTNAVKIDSTSVADDEYARFTANGLESRSTSEVLSDIGAITASSTDTLTNKTINASQLSGTVANARLDAQLQDVAGLAVTNGGFIVGDGSNFVLETGATARTSLGLGTAATLDTGISNTNVPKFTSSVADNDFLRVDGTAIEGRSASEVLSDIGAQASLTFGISNTNAVKIDSSSVADDEYARFTANGLESRSTSEVLSDIGGISASSTSTLTNKTLTTPVINGFSGTGDGSIIGDLTLKSTDDGSTVEPNLKLVRDSASPADSDFLGQVTFLGDNSAGEQITYAKLFSKIIDVTDGTEDGNFTFNVMSNGSSLTVLNFKGNGSTTFSSKDVLLGTGVDLRFEGSSANAHETTITPTNPTQDNTLTLPNVSGTFITTGNSDSPSTTTSSSDADFVLIDDGGTMKKITPANLGIPSDIDYGLITSSASSTEDYGAIT